MKTFAVTLAALLPLSALAAEPVPAPHVRNVAIVVYEGVEILDFAGPAEVLKSAGGNAEIGGAPALNVYTVARSTAPVTAQQFIKIVPNHSIEDAPRPDVVVIPGGQSSALTDDPAMRDWLMKTTEAAEVTLTVCTGAFPLAQAGRFDGMEITTWYGAIPRLQKPAPKTAVKNGRRFVDNGKYVTTAGVSAGIDGALHLVARLFGRRVADQTARYMEYHWTPEPFLSTGYAYWNPSTDDTGRTLQAVDMATSEGRWDDAVATAEKIAATRPADGRIYTKLGEALIAAGQHRRGAETLLRVPETSPQRPVALYNAACAYALAGDKAAALGTLQKSFAAGFDRKTALGDSDFDAMRDEVKALVASR